MIFGVVPREITVSADSDDDTEMNCLLKVNDENKQHFWSLLSNQITRICIFSVSNKTGFQVLWANVFVCGYLLIRESMCGEEVFN